MEGKNIVVTGGAGFIGSNLVRSLTKGNKVIIIDDLSTGKLENIRDLIDNQSIIFIEESITDLNLLNKTFKNVDYVFHQAAVPSVPKSLKDPIKSNYANVNSTLNVLVAARDNKVNKVIFASSSSVYGDTPNLPKREDMTPRPLSPYAVGKISSEYYCMVFSKIYNLPTICLRYFNVYGRRQDPSSNYAAVIPNFINKILNNKPLIIFGDGKQTRDFTYIEDVINANILAATSKNIGNFSTK